MPAAAAFARNVALPRRPGVVVLVLALAKLNGCGLSGAR